MKIDSPRVPLVHLWRDCFQFVVLSVYLRVLRQPTLFSRISPAPAVELSTPKKNGEEKEKKALPGIVLSCSTCSNGAQLIQSSSASQFDDIWNWIAHVLFSGCSLIPRRVIIKYGHELWMSSPDGWRDSQTSRSDHLISMSEEEEEDYPGKVSTRGCPFWSNSQIHIPPSYTTLVLAG